MNHSRGSNLIGLANRPLPAFIAVGAIGFALDAGLMLLTIKAFAWHPIGARLVSFPVAVSCTWLLNRQWAFRGRGLRSRSVEYAGYFAIQVAGAALNVGVFLGCLLLWPQLVSVPLVPLTLGAAVALLFNFALLRRTVYGGKRNAARVEDPAMTTAYSGVVNLEVMAEAVRYNRFLLGQIRSRLPGDNAPVMDFGAGSGTFAVPLHEAGVPITCVEPDEGLRERLAACGLAVVPDVDGLQQQTFSFIYSLNVLEHIDDDQAALERLRDLLAPDGVLLLYVPAFQSLYSSMDRKVGHFRRYRRPDLVRLLTSAGYVVEHARYVDSIGFLAALAYRWLGRDDGTISRTALVLYDRWVFPVSAALDRLAGRWFGKNVLVIAKVPAK